MSEQRIVYTAQEVAKVLGLSLTGVYQLCRQPDFPAIRVSPRRIIIPVDGLKAWMERHAGCGNGTV